MGMFEKKHWVFRGESGEDHSFECFSRSDPLPDSGGIYILTYTHPRGHLAGFQVNILFMDATDDLRAEVSGLQNRERLLKACWNYTCILRLGDPKIRAALLEDLAAGNPVSS